MNKCSLLLIIKTMAITTTILYSEEITSRYIKLLLNNFFILSSNFKKGKKYIGHMIF